MGTTIDTHVTEMVFNNDDFEKGVDETLKSIGELKNNLSFDKMADGADNLTKALSGLGIEKVGDGVTKLVERFSAWGIVGIEVIRNITNSVINLGEKMLRTLAIDPIKSGWYEYETLLNSIQTILANTAKENTTLPMVNAYLDELNEYSDKTIYNFQQMAKNVGTFTAAGVKLDTSVNAIKGIANLAAVSGSSADQASMAMYQLSQALASGTVRLMDWNSVVNAGMGGEVFKSSLMETARVHGINIDAMIKKEGSFRDTLQNGWLTSEILLETLSKFTGDLTEEQLKAMGYTEEQVKEIIELGKTATDAATKVKTFTQLLSTLAESAQSGWAETWEIVIGDFEEAKRLWTSVNDVVGGIITRSADARNKMLKDWKELGGRGAIVYSLTNIFKVLGSVLEEIGSAFREVFPAATGEQLYRISLALWAFTITLRPTKDTLEDIKSTFKGLFSVLDIGIRVFKEIGSRILEFFGGIDKSPLKDLLSDMGDFGDALTKWRDNIVAGDSIAKTFDNAGKIMSDAWQKVMSIVSKVVDLFSEIEGIDLGPLGDSLANFFGKIKITVSPMDAVFTTVSEIITGFFKVIAWLLPKVFTAIGKLGDMIAGLLNQISGAMSETRMDQFFITLNSFLGSAILTEGVFGLSKLISAFGNFGSFLKSVSVVMDNVSKSLQAWQANVHAKTLLTIALALAVTAVSLLLLASVDAERLKGSMAAVAGLLASLAVSFAILQEIAKRPDKAVAMATAIVGIGIALLLLASAVAVLGSLSSDELRNGFLAITIISGELVVLSNLLSNIGGSLIKAAFAMSVFATALIIMAGAVYLFGAMEPEKLKQGLSGVAAVLTEFAIFMTVAGNTKMSMKSAIGIFIVSAAILILYKAVEALGSLDQGVLEQGLTALGAIMMGISAFMIVIQGGSGTSLLAASVGIAVITGSLYILVGVLEKIGSLSPDVLIQGLKGIAVALTILVASMYAMPQDVIVKAAALLVVSAALYVLADVLTVFGAMSWEQIGAALVMLAGSLIVIAVGMQLMASSIPGALALLIVAGALMMLVPALQALGNMSIESLIQSMLALVALFLILGVAGYALTPMIPTLLGVGAAMLLLGLGLALVGVGFLAFSVGLAAFATVVGASGGALLLFVAGLIGLIPLIVKQLGVALLAIIDVLVEGAPKLLTGIVVLLTTLLQGLITLIPMLVDGIVLLITEVLLGLQEIFPVLVDTGWLIILTIYQGMRDHLEDFIVLALEVVTAFINGLTTGLPGLVEAAWNFIIAFIDSITLSIDENMATLIESVTKLAVAFVLGFVEGVLEQDAVIRQGMVDLGTMLMDNFKETMGISSPSSVFAEYGLNIIEGLANGIKDNIWRAVAKTYALCTAVLDKIKEMFKMKSPSKVTDMYGEYIVMGLANGIKSASGLAVESTETVADSIITTFQSAMETADEFLSTNMDMSPVITPVLDLRELIAAQHNMPKYKVPVTTTAMSNELSSSIGAPEVIGQNGSEKQSSGSAVTYVQNNYSPASLSRFEIYRQTRNQLLLAQTKGILK